MTEIAVILSMLASAIKLAREASEWQRAKKKKTLEKLEADKEEAEERLNDLEEQLPSKWAFWKKKAPNLLEQIEEAKEKISNLEEEIANLRDSL